MEVKGEGKLMFDYTIRLAIFGESMIEKCDEHCGAKGIPYDVLTMEKNKSI